MMGLYANIAAKKKRIEAQKAAGKTPERMRKVGSKGAPTADAFRISSYFFSLIFLLVMVHLYTDESV